MRPLFRLAVLVLFLLILAAGYWFLMKPRARVPMSQNQRDQELVTLPMSENQRRQEIVTLFNAIADLTRQRPFAPDAVARIAGKFLQADPSRSDSSFVVFRSGVDAQAVLQRVELSIPTSTTSKTEGSAFLSVNVAARIAPEAVDERFEMRPRPPGAVGEHLEGWVRRSDREDPYHVDSYVYECPRGYVTFEFAFPDRYLKSVHINTARLEPVARPRRQAFWQPSEEGRILKDLREAIVSGKDIPQVCQQVLKLLRGFAAEVRPDSELCDVRFPSPIEAEAFCRSMGWERPYAVSGDVHQVSWRIALKTTDLKDSYGRPLIGIAFPQLGKWSVDAELANRPPGDLPGVSWGTAPAYDLHRYPAEVIGLRIGAALFPP